MFMYIKPSYFTKWVQFLSFSYLLKQIFTFSVMQGINICCMCILWVRCSYYVYIICNFSPTFLCNVNVTCCPKISLVNVLSSLPGSLMALNVWTSGCNLSTEYVVCIIQVKMFMKTYVLKALSWQGNSHDLNSIVNCSQFVGCMLTERKSVNKRERQEAIIHEWHHILDRDYTQKHTFNAIKDSGRDQSLRWNSDVLEITRNTNWGETIYWSNIWWTACYIGKCK